MRRRKLQFRRSLLRAQGSPLWWDGGGRLLFQMWPPQYQAPPFFSVGPEAFRGKWCVWSRHRPAAHIRPSPPGWAQPWVTVAASVASLYESALAAVTKGHGPEGLVDRNVNVSSQFCCDLGSPRPRCWQGGFFWGLSPSCTQLSSPCVFVCPPRLPLPVRTLRC